MTDHFTCADCGGTYEMERSDEEALAEAAVNFPDLAPEDRVVVCDDCYNGIRQRAAAVGIRWGYAAVDAAVEPSEGSDRA